MDDASTELNEPLRLVEISSVGGNLSLNTKNVTKVLSSVQGLPLSVINIAGPPGNGKSILLAYLIRYFSAAENDELEWMDWDNPTKEAIELKWPREGMSPNDLGIWSYPRPFILTGKDGLKTTNTAVILLYTQSSDKNIWDKEATESNHLMGLALLLSSNIIFNVYKHLDEECISSVGTHIKYALKCGSKMHPAKRGKLPQAPLQNACFLIRDWNFPAEHPYGMTGGRNFVKVGKPKESLKHSRTSRESRQLITGSFQNISGCLLPFPGTSVTSSKDFKGSISEMSKEFAKSLEDLISKTCNVDDMTLKMDLSGKIVTGKMFLQMAERYVEVAKDLDENTINSRQLFKQFRINVTNSPQEQKQYIKLAMKKYADIWTQYEKRNKHFDDKSLIGVQKKARVAAIKLFEAEVKCQDGGSDDDESGKGDDSEDENTPRVDERVKKQLISKIVERFEMIKKERSKMKAQFMQQCTAEMVQQYRDWICESYPEGTNTKSLKHFLRDSKNYKADICTDFMEKIGASGEADEMDDNEQAEIGNLMDALEKEENVAYETYFGRMGTSKNVGADDPVAKGIGRKFGKKSTPILLKPGNRKRSRATGRATSSDSSLMGSTLSVNRSNLSISSRVSDTSNEDVISKSRPQKHSTTPARGRKEQTQKDDEKLRIETKKLIDRLTRKHSTKLDDVMKDEDVDLRSIHQGHLKTLVREYEEEAPYASERKEHNMYKGILEDELSSVFSTASRKLKAIRESRKKMEKEAKEKAVTKPLRISRKTDVSASESESEDADRSKWAREKQIENRKIGNASSSKSKPVRTTSPRTQIAVTMDSDSDDIDTKPIPIERKKLQNKMADGDDNSEVKPSRFVSTPRMQNDSPPNSESDDTNSDNAAEEAKKLCTTWTGGDPNRSQTKAARIVPKPSESVSSNVDRLSGIDFKPINSIKQKFLQNTESVSLQKKVMNSRENASSKKMPQSLGNTKLHNGRKITHENEQHTKNDATSESESEDNSDAVVGKNGRHNTRRGTGDSEDSADARPTPKPRRHIGLKQEESSDPTDKTLKNVKLQYASKLGSSSSQQGQNLLKKHDNVFKELASKLRKNP